MQAEVVFLLKKAVLFDLDGTLLNSLPDIANCMNQVLRRYGLPAYPQADYRYMTGNGAVLLARRAVGAREDLHADVLRDYAALYAAHCYDSSHLYAGIREMVAALRSAGVRMAVVSNKDEGDVARVVAHYFPDAPFDVTRGRLPGVSLKPDPAPVLAAARSMGLAPADFWYLGDTPTDLECAGRAGMDFIAVSWGFRTAEELRATGAVRVADTPAEALGMLLNG